MTIAPGAAEPITFFTQACSLGANTSLELEEVDAHGNVLGTLGVLTDSGKFADARRGDGIFSLQIIVQADQPVIRYFRAKTLENSVAKVSSVMPLWITASRSNLAAVEVSGSLSARAPIANASVATLAIKDDTIYMGGAFTL